jgi:hypothetical protein
VALDSGGRGGSFAGIGCLLDQSCGGGSVRVPLGIHYLQLNRYTEIRKRNNKIVKDAQFRPQCILQQQKQHSLMSARRRMGRCRMLHQPAKIRNTYNARWQ